MSIKKLNKNPEQSNSSMEVKDMAKDTLSSNDENASDDSIFSKDLSDTTYSGKDEYSNYNEVESCLGEKVELKARSLFFDSIPKRNCKRKRMKKDLSKKPESACASSSDEAELRDPSLITIKAIHIYPKESSISSTFTSENSFQPRESSPKKNQIDDGKRQSEYKNIMYVSHPHYKRTQLLTNLSQSVADDVSNDLNIRPASEAKENSQESMKYAERYMTIDGGERLSPNEVDTKNKEFLSLLPREFLPYIEHKPSIFEYAPISLSKAVGLSRHARFITEAKFPFRILHANARFFKLIQDKSSSILGKPLSTLKDGLILESFLQILKDDSKPTESLGRKDSKSQDIESIERTLKDTQITGKLPKCFIKLFLVGSNASCNQSEEKEDTVQVTHFLAQIETKSLAMSNIVNEEIGTNKDLPTRTIG